MGLMFFLLRLAFWLGIVLILLPTGSAQQASATSNVGASDAISAASATVHDLRDFCTREPDACSVGAQVATQIGYRAQAGAKMLYEFLTETLASRQVVPAATSTEQHSTILKTGLDKSSSHRAPQNTLTPADLAPGWRGPPSRKDAKHAA
jgi:hypothetical protein